jgi:hypothetical protein
VESIPLMMNEKADFKFKILHDTLHACYNIFFILFKKDCENYWCHPNWIGYESIGCHCGRLQQSLLYHVVLTTEADLDGGVKTFAYEVPETWMDQSLQYFLYPPAGFNVHGSKPWNWGEISFKKRRFRDETFVEYDVADVLTETGPGKYYFIVYVTLKWFYINAF